MQKLHLDSDKRLVSSVLVLELIPILWFLGVDLFMYAHDWPRLRARLAIRAVSIAVPVAGIFLIRVVRTRGQYSDAVLGIAAILTAVQLALNLLRPQGGILPMRTTFMFLFAYYGALPNTLRRQIAPPLAFSAGIALERLFWLTDNTAGDFAGDLVIMLFVNAVGVLIVRRRIGLEREVNARLAAEEAALAEAARANEELKILRGIIPICAWCKSVRTGEGDWEQIEYYISTHSDAEFSHGICPTCRGAHYPQSSGR